MGPFKVLGIADADITIDTENELVIFQCIYVRPYNHYIKKNNISHLRMANGLAKIPIDKPANKEIYTSLDYSEP